MNRRMGPLLGFFSSCCLLMACGDDPVPAFDLAATLAAAEPGDVVTVEAGSYAGPVTVPAGVTLRVADGATAELTQADPGAAVTVLSTAGFTTTVEGLHITSAGSVAVLVRGNGAVVLRGLTIDVSRGFGLLAEGPTSLIGEDVALTGHIDAPRELRYPIDAAQFPTIGLGLSNVAAAQLARVDISGFSGFGAVLSNSSGTWAGGALTDNLGVGLLQQGGSWQLAGLAVTGTQNCEHITCAVSNQVFALALVAGTGAEAGQLETASLDLSDNRGIAYFQQGGRSRHEDLLAADNQLGVWLQEVSGTGDAWGFELAGQGSALSSNGGAGLVVLRSSGVRLEGTAISATIPLAVATGPIGTVTMADGIQVSDLAGELALQDVSIQTDNPTGNARVGLLLDGASDPAALVALDGVDIQGSAGNGLILQGGTEAQDDWDVAVGATLQANDEAFTGSLEVAAVRLGVPSAAVVGENGLVGVRGVVGENGLVGLNSVVGENGVVGPPELVDGQ